jgi:hypothetical protein
MFRWYRNAAKCYVYLSDVSAGAGDKNGQSQRSWESAFRNSRWFTRGWTLQELLAPESVELFSQEGELLGDEKILEQQIHEITGIPIAALRGAPLSEFCVDERLRWAENRQLQVEDSSPEESHQARRRRWPAGDSRQCPRRCSRAAVFRRAVKACSEASSRHCDVSYGYASHQHHERAAWTSLPGYTIEFADCHHSASPSFLS